LVPTEYGSCKGFLIRVKNLFHQIYTVGITLFFTAVLGGLTILVGGAEALILRKKPGQGEPIVLGRLFRSWWGKSILFFHGVRLEAKWIENLDPHRGYIIVANHQSALDILVAISVLPTNLVFLAKKELSKVPILGWASWIAGCVYIDRTKGLHDDTAIRSVREAIRRKNLIIIFPEGTRSQDGQLLPFKRGAFMLAIQSGSPLYLMTICGSHELLPKSHNRIRSGKIGVFLGPVLNTEGLSEQSRFVLSKKVRSEMLKNLDQWTQRENNKG